MYLKINSTATASNSGANLKKLMSRVNRKLFLVLLIAVLTAGYVQAQFTFGARAGVNYTNMLFFVPAGSASMGTQMQTGFQAGVVTADRNDHQVGLLIVSQKCKFDKGSLMGFSNETLNLTYLRMPVSFLYKKDLNDMKFLLQGGFSLGLAVAGKITGEKHGEKVEEKITFAKGGMSRFDSGLGLGAGLQFGNIQTVLEYNLSYNLSNDNKVMMFNNGFALNATYFFNK